MTEFIVSVVWTALVVLFITSRHRLMGGEDATAFAAELAGAVLLSMVTGMVLQGLYKRSRKRSKGGAGDKPMHMYQQPAAMQPYFPPNNGAPVIVMGGGWQQPPPQQIAPPATNYYFDDDGFSSPLDADNHPPRYGSGGGRVVKTRGGMVP